MRGKPFLAVVVLSLSVAGVAARADEIRLKDGTKITGTIVGFESDSFRIETSYGFALVRKDMVSDISITSPPKRPEPSPKSAEPPAQSSAKPALAPAAVFPTVTRETIAPTSAAPDTDGVLQPPPAKAKGPSPPTKASSTAAASSVVQAPASPGSSAVHPVITTTAEPAVARTPTPPAKGGAPVTAKGAPTITDAKAVAATPPGMASAKPVPAAEQPGTSAGTPAAAKTEPASPNAKPAAATAATPPPPAAPPTPSVPSEPPVIRDEIHGNQYVNVTYGFQMYRPPSWDVIPAARKSLPGAVAALGTSDHTTMLVIGRDHAKDSLDAHAAATEKALGEAYDNYRVISTKHLTIAGLSAVEQRSRGTADGHDWSLLLMTFFKGSDAFTLLGMTWADSDLIQVQENVIAKAVNSLTFAVP